MQDEDTGILHVPLATTSDGIFFGGGVLGYECQKGAGVSQSRPVLSWLMLAICTLCTAAPS